MTMTNALKARLLDAYYGDAAVAPPATLYVALSTTTPALDGTGFTRPAGNGYADVAVANTAANWPAASVADPSEKANGVEVEYPVPTGSWGTITHWGVCETDGGAPVDWAALDTARDVGVGSEPVKFAVGALRTRLQAP